MTPDVQRWIALAVVALAAGWLLWRWWSRRGREHEGCGCPGARGHRDLAKLKKRRR